MSKERVIDLSARRGRTEADLHARLLKAYCDAKASGGGRRVARQDLVFAERKQG